EIQLSTISAIAVSSLYPTERREASSNRASGMDSILSATLYLLCQLGHVPLFIYFPDFTLASLGFSASAGITHEYPILTAPGIRFSTQSTCIRRTEIPHFSEICRIEQYSIIRPPKYALDLP